MNAYKTYVVLLIFGLLTTGHLCTGTLYLGSVQFPETLQTIPEMRIYYAGQKVAAESNNKTKNVTFSIAQDNGSTFYVVITNHLEWDVSPHTNTISHLKVAQNQPYKFYKIVRRYSDITHEYSWHVDEIPLLKNLLPDNAIILCCNPDYIEALEVKHSVDLPKIVIKKNILDIVGSESQLHEESIKSLLTSLDSNTVHTTMKPETKKFYQKLVVASL